MEVRPRLLLLTPDYPPDSGGIQLLAHRAFAAARALDVRVVTLGTPGGERFDAAEDLSVRRVAGSGGPRGAAVGVLSAAAVQEALSFRPQAIVSMHIVVGPAALLAGRLLGAPVIQWVHADELRARPALARAALRGATAVVAVSRHAHDLALRAGADPSRIELIPPGVDLPPESPEPRSARPTVLTVAGLAFRYKGHDVMVRALSLARSRVPGLRWIVVGDGPLRPEIQALTAAYELDEAVSFCGAVDDEERDRWLARSWAFAMPSRQPDGGGGEGFGIAYLEAAAHALPVLAGNVGGAVDAVADGETGLLVDPADHLVVAEGLSTLLGNPDLARRLGQAGRARAAEFAWERVAQRVERLVARLLTRS